MLRPLRTIDILPGLKLLVVVLINSVSQLVNVVALLGFVFFVFGILGLQVRACFVCYAASCSPMLTRLPLCQLWVGSFHFRCRLTDRPFELGALDAATYLDMKESFFSDEPSPAAVSLVQQLMHNRTAFPYCGVTDTGAPLPVSDNDWTKASSPWNTARNCAWPIDEADTRLCSLSSLGAHQCGVGRVRCMCHASSQ